MQDFADVAQSVRESETLRDQILATARRRWPHATRIEIDAFGSLRVELPHIIDAHCVEKARS